MGSIRSSLSDRLERSAKYSWGEVDILKYYSIKTRMEESWAENV